MVATLRAKLESREDIHVARQGFFAPKEAFRMSLNLSLAPMLTQLETKVAHHSERKRFHAEQEVSPVRR